MASSDMTLKEWVSVLPESHGARAELERLTTANTELAEALEAISKTNIAGYIIRGGESSSELIDMIKKYYGEFLWRVATARTALASHRKAQEESTS